MRQDFLPAGPCPARLMIVGEAPGENEVRLNTPFVGASGLELNRMLQEAGLDRAQAFLTNVCRVRPLHNDIEQFLCGKARQPGPEWSRVRDRWATAEVTEGLALLEAELAINSPTVVLALGNAALWALTGKWGIKKWRGSLLRATTRAGHEFTIVPTYHPAAVLRQWALRPTVVHDMRRVAAVLSGRGPAYAPEWAITIRPTFRRVRAFFRLMAYLRACNPTIKIAPDIETRGGHIACIGIAWTAHSAISIPLMCLERSEGYWDQDQEVWICDQLGWLFGDPAFHCVGQNWLYDAQYISRHLYIRAAKVTDTMIAQHTMWSAQPKGLDYLASLYCGAYEYWKDEGKEWDPSMPEDDLWYYNAKDCVYTYQVETGEAAARWELAAAGWPKLHEIHEFQQRLFGPVFRMMERGIRPNLALRNEFTSSLMAASAARTTMLREVLGYDLNINSPPQMQDLFYNQFGFRKHYKRGKPGAPMSVTCDDAALAEIAASEPLVRPIVTAIQQLRSIGVFLNTFVNMSMDTDGRIRCSFNIAGTKTYRFSSSKSAFGSGTNLQNVPSGDEAEATPAEAQLPNVRRLFTPDNGKTIFDIDLDSADLRIVAWDSGCTALMAWLNEGRKPYVEIAREYLHDPTITKAHPQYRVFKSVCHGTNYLGTPEGMAPRVGLLVHELDRIQHWYFGKFPEIKAWHERIRSEVTGRGYIENVFGYRFYFQDRITPKTFNEAVAWIPQSTVGCLINRILVNIDENLPWAELLLQVHDSLMGQYPTWMGGRAEREIVAQAQIPLAFPSGTTVIPVGLKRSSTSWGDCR